MLGRIKNLVDKGGNFAFETTLSTKSYTKFIEKAKSKGYSVTLLFLWLNSEDLAVKRVQVRVEEGGHNIPEKVIRRRYQNGLINFFKLYKPIVNDWMFVNNSGNFYEIIAEGTKFKDEILNTEIWSILTRKYDE